MSLLAVSGYELAGMVLLIAVLIFVSTIPRPRRPRAKLFGR